MKPIYIEVSAGVRYWEDATVNEVSDDSGLLIPFKNGNDWCPVIHLDDGLVIDWPIGTVADIHYKVCDDGEYWLLDENKQRIAKWGGYYVPDEFLCHGDNGYGDYIIFKVDLDGSIINWKKPEINFVCADGEHSQSGWIKIAKAEGDRPLANQPKQTQADRLYKAVERLALQAGEDAAETIDWLCGEHGGMFKLFEAYFSPKPLANQSANPLANQPETSGSPMDSSTDSADSAETFGKRDWVWLTDDDRIEIAHSMDGGVYGFCKTWGWLNYAKALEAKCKEKNT